MRRPEPTKWGEPSIDLHEGLWPNAVDTALRINSRLDEAGIAQYAEVLRHRRLRQSKSIFDLPDRALGRCQEAQDRSTIGFGKNGEGGFHDMYMLF